MNLLLFISFFCCKDTMNISMLYILLTQFYFIFYLSFTFSVKTFTELQFVIFAPPITHFESSYKK